jgi:hypothetical protein
LHGPQCRSAPLIIQKGEVMNIEEFIRNVDSGIKANWESEAVSNSYSKEEAKIATVLTRQDTALIASINGYNSKILESIKSAVWLLVVIYLVDIYLTHFRNI